MTFELVWEIDSPAEPSLDRVRRQVDALTDLADAVLVPENPTGRAGVSSLVVAGVARAAGKRPIACLNARDRNLLGLRRDLLTAEVLAVDEVLLVHGDEPEIGVRTAGTTVRSMLDACHGHGMRAAVTARLAPIPRWKLDADRLFVQVSYSLDDLLRWRDTITFTGPVHPAVLVVPSVAMATRLSARVPALAPPPTWLDAVAVDPTAGFHLAAALVAAIRDSGAFEGVHVVGGPRFLSASSAVRAALEHHVPSPDRPPRSTHDDRHPDRCEPRLPPHGERPRAQVGARTPLA